MATAIFDLEATTRSDLGKGASRRLRRLENLIPGIVYGASEKPQNVSLQQHIVRKALENEAFYSHVLTLKINGKAEKVVLKDLQRHPYKPVIMHMDFLRVDMKKVIHMHVPLHFINEDIAPGVKEAGGQIFHKSSDVEVSCLPSDLPEFIEVDLSQCQLDETIHLSQLVVPKNVKIIALSHGEEHNNDMAVVSIHMPKVIIEEVEEVEEVEEAKTEEAETEKASEVKAEAPKKDDKKNK